MKRLAKGVSTFWMWPSRDRHQRPTPERSRCLPAIAEAVSLGDHLQIDRNILLDVLSKTAVVAPAMAGKFRKIKDGDYSPEFPLRLMSKDMDLVMDAAMMSGADLPAASVAQSVLASNVSASGDLDLSAITPFVIGQGTRTAV